MKSSNLILCSVLMIMGLAGGCAQGASSGSSDKPVILDTTPPTPTANENCAEQLILAAAKTNVANTYGNRPESGGDCALGVRTSLQLSGVGGITGGIGNAIDYLANLPPYGFVATGALDPNTATPGSVIVFSGPNSASYLSTGTYGTPPGDWLGHVTIKGDDGYYYTDARTVEAAIGWENGVNVDGERDVAGIFVPDAALVAQYAGKCPTSQSMTMNRMRIPLTVVAAIAALTPTFAMAEGMTTPTLHSPKDFQALNYANANDRITGHRLMKAAVAQMVSFTALPSTDSHRSDMFQAMLDLALQALPYDGEGQFTKLMAKSMLADSSLQSQYDKFMQSQTMSCKTQLMTTAISEAKCQQTAGMSGQDYPKGSANNGKSCVSNFNYLSCISSSTQ